MSDYSEEEFVDFLCKHTVKNRLARPGDDCAVFSEESEINLVTTDALVREIHYSEDFTAEEIATKLVGVNVSDIAAMGGQPQAAVVSYSGRRRATELEDISRFIQEELAEFGAELVGGDITKTPNDEVFCMTLFGRAGEHLLRRSGGQPGDLLAVSGPLGGARAVLEKNPESKWRKLLYSIKPEVELGRQLVDAGGRCAIDVSDGLIKDLKRIMKASSVGAKINPESIPLHPAVSSLSETKQEALIYGLTGGEEYILLSAIPPALKDWADEAGLKIIGELNAETEELTFAPPLPFENDLISNGWDHFKTGENRDD